MSSNEPDHSELPGREPTDEEDYDLLTYGEAGERLRLEVAAQEDLIRRTDDTDPRLVQRQHRLQGLKDAQKRNTKHDLNDRRFAELFGFESSEQASPPTDA